MTQKYIDNPSLKYIDLPFEWRGTPIDQHGRFINHEFKHDLSFQLFLKWQTTKNKDKALKKKVRSRYEVVDIEVADIEKSCIIWLGHASFYIQLNKLKLLIDPVLFDMPLIKRHTRLPLDPQQIRNIDYILISHDHRDHLDQKSLALLSAANPNAVYLSGLNNESLLKKFTKSDAIQTAGWYQQYDLPADLRITYLPSRHWGRRAVNDTNHRLWGGFLIQAEDKTIYFSGDSGYGSHFADLQRICPNIDYFLVGIGAYKPEFFMGQSHMSPTDALRAFGETKAKYMIPMHHSTFDLSDEPLHDPIESLRALAENHFNSNSILYPKIGEQIFL